MTRGSAGAIASAAREWWDAWNRRDLDVVMIHYTENVEFSSPTVVQRWGIADAWWRGKDRLRANFEIGLRRPDLRFEHMDVSIGASGCSSVVYRRETGALVTDLVEMAANGRGRRVVACHGAAPPGR